MAWIFATWVQCETASEAAAVAAHFRGRSHTLSDGTVTTLDVGDDAVGVGGSVPGADGHCWIRPSNVSRTGVGSEADARQLSEVGHFLLETLATAPPFWFALTGVEVDDVRDRDDVIQLLRSDHPVYRGTVTTEAQWRAAGEPAGYEPFRPGYVWRPYPGEPWPRR